MANAVLDHDGDGLTYKGAHYTCTTAPIHDDKLGPDCTGLHFGWEPTTTCNDCPHGHPHEVPGAERVAASVEDAVAKGWLTRD